MRNLLALAERLALVSLGARRSGQRCARATRAAVGFSPPCVTLGGLPSGEREGSPQGGGRLPEEGGMSGPNRGQGRARVLCCTMLIYDLLL